MELIFLAILILLNAGLALSEIAVLTAKPHLIRTRADEGARGADATIALQSRPARFLASIQLGITLVGLAGGAVSGVTLGARLGAMLETLPVVSPIGMQAGIAVVVVGIGYLWVVIGELAPKRIALAYAEPLAMRLAPTLQAIARLAALPVRLLAVSTNAVARLFGVSGPPDAGVTADEISAILRHGTRDGAIGDAERGFTERVLRLGERTVAAVMTPRPDVVFLRRGDPAPRIREIVTLTGHTRYPVLDAAGHDAVGFVHTKDLLAEWDAPRPDLAGLIHPPLFIPQVASLLRALERMKQSGTHVALAVDEHGSVQGLLTVHDVFEAIVGEVPATQEGDYPELVHRPDGSWLADGVLPVAELTAALGAPDFPGPEFAHCETVGGLVMACLARIPKTGDEATCAGVALEVVDMDERRVDKVLVTYRPDRDAPRD